MKKLISFILLSAILLTFTACSSDNEENGSDTTSSDASVSESIKDTAEATTSETEAITEDTSEAEAAKVNLLGEWIPSVKSVEENSNTLIRYAEHAMKKATINDFKQDLYDLEQKQNGSLEEK